MKTGTLIIGQGLCGTWLSYWLQKQGAEFIIIDNNAGSAATKAASGIINPVTGRRIVKTWLADELLPFAFESYTDLGAEINESLVSQAKLYDFFSAPDRRLSFEKRAEEFESYLEWPTDENEWREFFNYPFGFGIVSPVYQVNLQGMLGGWRKYLKERNKVLTAQFDYKKLGINNSGICYENIEADQVIFCDGTAVMEQPYFKMLPFAFNKGEALVINVPGLPQHNLYKKGNTITPWQGGLFWAGSSYNRDYKDDLPSAEFYGQMTGWLKSFLKIPFTVEDHLAAIRPTTVERRPFAGMHPVHSNVGILNGMGTKGVSLAPYLARQFADHLLNKTPLMKEVDVKKYSGVLGRR